MPRKQLNIGLTPEQHDLVKAAAEDAEMTVTAFCRQAIIDAATPPEPEDQIDTYSPGFLAWLMALLAAAKQRTPAA